MAEKFTIIFKHERVTINDDFAFDNESIEEPKYAFIITEDYVSDDDVNYIIDQLVQKIKES